MVYNQTVFTGRLYTRFYFFRMKEGDVIFDTLRAEELQPNPFFGLTYPLFDTLH